VEAPKLWQVAVPEAQTVALPVLQAAETAAVVVM